ncbi:hypothetical protein Vretimale_2446 [Volvox reticuliferus]|uniref:Uncharacterized protein n=1 Tax=Volvox reticuliferus TaxID=1737510 RepID=A0A8J4FH64_9CHLO|nr:hypothetical protein Vretifemale_4746 [Volvox reticuliferus]GIL96689.1 hypothetical protein Vretimale_2446 [Volvox reticuliferus]
MKDVTLKLTPGHGPGQASVAYAATAKDLYLTTTGADGRLFLRDSLVLEPEQVAKVDAPPATILAVDPKGKYVAVGDDQYVKLHKLPSLSLERVACRFNLTLRALSFSPDGSKLAAGGDDSLIKLVEVKEGSVYRSLSCEDYVLSLAWDPEGTYLAVVLRSGGLVLYDTSNGRVEKRVELLCERVDYSSPRRHTPSWHPDGGTVLAVPVGAEGEVVLYERLSWEATGYLSGEHTAAVNVVAFSPNGLYAATAGQDKRVVIWDVGVASAIAAASATEVISGLAWRLDGNELAMVGESGGVGIWSGPVPKELPGPAVPAEELERMQQEQERLADLKRQGASRQARGQGAGDADLVPPEGGEIREEIIEEMEVGVDTAAAASGDGADGGATGAQAAAAETTSSAGGADVSAGNDGDGVGSELNDGGAGARARDRRGDGLRTIRPGNMTGTRPATQTVRTIVRTIVAPPAGPAPQPPFQPGATPAEPGRPRFLCYNMIGSVASRPVDDHHAIEVLFHDSSRFSARVPLLTDYYGFDRASLGEKGVFYASLPTKGDTGAEGGESGAAGVPAMVMFRPFDPWAPNSDWTAPLPPGEEALCLATGRSFLAVATSRQLLRLFSLAGSQTAISRLEGPPVAMAAVGSLLAIVWHAGPPNPHTKSQQLFMSMYDTTAMSCVFSQPLPLTPGSLLTWLGFTEDHGLPAVADSQGVVCVRTPDFGGRWLPVFEPSADRRHSEVLWPVGVTSNQLYAIVCKPTEPRPQVSPRPFYTPMSLALPVLALDGGCPPELEGQALLLGLANASLRSRLESAEAGGLVEEASDLNHLLLRGQAEQDRALLKAFQRVVKGERHARALEMAAQLNMFKSLEGALTLANHHQARGLAERISVFMASRQAMLEAAAPAAAPVPQGPTGASQDPDPYGNHHQRNQRSYTPIPFDKRGAAVDREDAAPGLSAGPAHDAEQAGAGGSRGASQPLQPANFNTARGAGSGAGSLTPFANLVASEPGDTGGLSTGPKSARGLPTPNTLLQAATAKPDGGDSSHKRKPVQSYNNPFARKAPKLAK